MEPSSLNMIVAYIQPFQLEDVVDALRRVPGCPGFSVSDVRGVGCGGAHPPHKGKRSEVYPLEHKARIEVFCGQVDTVAIMEAIRRAAHTGNPGDGKIFAMPVTLGARIRTGETGEAAVRP